MKYLLRTIIVLITIAVACTACEYELSGEFNQGINKPAATHQGSITLSKDMDSIVIYEPTEIQYNINSFGLECNGIQLDYLNTKITNEYSSSGTFSITPDYNITGWFDLKANYFLGTGSGSIADKFKAENYQGTRTWKVCFIDLTKFDFKFQHHINKDGFLELFWIKPSFLPAIYSSINQSSTIHPHISKIAGDTTFFADSTYYGGNSSYYTLDLNLNQRNIYGKTIIPDYPFPDITLTPFGLDSAVVSWTKSPLRRYYKVYGSAWQHYIFTGFENSFKIRCLPGIIQDIYLEIYPYDFKNNIYNYSTVNTKYKNGVVANYKFTYSYVKDQFYIPSPYNISQIEKVDITTPEGNAYANNGINKYELWGNHQGTRFVGVYSGDIHIFDESLNEVRKITIGNDIENYGGQMTDDNCFSYYNYNESLCYLINVGTNFMWQQFSFKPSASDESIWGSIRLSIDGKYVFWRGDKYFIIYDVSNHLNANVVYQCPVSEVYCALGNPLNYKEVIIGKSTKIEVRTLPGFQLIKQLDLPGEGNSELLTFDTYSNSFLALSEKYFHVINMASMKDVLKFGGNVFDYGLYSARLHRNNFFLNGTKTDLTPYLNK